MYAELLNKIEPTLIIKPGATVDYYFNLRDEGSKVEFINGDLVVHFSASLNDVYKPDVIPISNEKLDRVKELYLDSVPEVEIEVEILSRLTKKFEL